MNPLLGQLAKIRSGVTVRERIIESPEGKNHLLQFRDINKETYRITGATRMDGTHYHKKHILQVGDILFTAKGAHNNAILCRAEDLAALSNPLAASIFTVIRPLPSLLLSEYLAWYINSPVGQQALERFKGGSVISSVSSRDLRQLPIPLPDLERQSSIVQLVELLEHEEALHLQIINEKKRLVNQLIYDKIQ